jgi:hypothetical protein
MNPHWAAVKIRQNLLFLGSFRFGFTGSQTASCMHFQGRNFRFRASEKVPERMFKIMSNFQRRKQKNFDLIFLTKMHPNLLWKTISEYTEIPNSYFLF